MDTLEMRVQSSKCVQNVSRWKLCPACPRVHMTICHVDNFLGHASDNFVHAWTVRNGRSVDDELSNGGGLDGRERVL